MHVSPLRSITYLWQGQGHWIRLWETVCFLSSPRFNSSWFQNLWISAQAFSTVTVQQPTAPTLTGYGGDRTVATTAPLHRFLHLCSWEWQVLLQTAEIQVHQPCGSQDPGSEVRFVTSTEHRRGEGLKLHVIQPLNLSLVAINRQVEWCVACAHCLQECEHGT